jgi:hypothetical protein
MKSPLNAYKYADTGEYAANASAKVIKPIVNAEIGMGIIKGAQNFKESYDSAKKGKADAEEKGRKNQLQEDLTRSQIELNESKSKNLNPTSALEDDTSFVSTGQFGDTSVEGMVESAMPKRKQILGAPENYKNPLTQMKGSPNKLIGDTMDPYGQINPGAVPPNQAQNDLGAQPIIGAQGSQPSARAIDMAAIENPYATPGADFNPQSKMKAESIFGSAGQRQGLMNLGTPLHHDSEKQAHTHPTKTTTKISGKGEMPGSSYVKGDYVDEDDLQDVGLQRHIATLAQSDSKGTFIKQMPDTGPESNISTAKGFGEKIRLNNMSRPDYTSNEGSQMDPHDFLFKNTPKK